MFLKLSELVFRGGKYISMVVLLVMWPVSLLSSTHYYNGNPHHAAHRAAVFSPENSFKIHNLYFTDTMYGCIHSHRQKC